MMKSTVTTIDPTGLDRRTNRVGPFFLTLALLSLFAAPVFSQNEEKKRGGGKKGGKPDSKDTDTWSAEEYSGLRGEKDLQAALASKGFAWISGSPADNEKLSVGKNAQFFGFVALRYQSGRAANRGMLGRAMFAIADEAQRARMAEAVNAEKAAMQEWWVVREEILTLLEDHLYTGQSINREKLAPLGERFSLLNSMVATHEAAAFAAFEDSMTSAQRDIMARWRADAESAGDYGRDVRVEYENVDRDDQKQLEDLYAKAFSWITGKPEDNEIIPIGQPAQFFGFVSIRHKSGHAASRGTIAKDFFAMLNDEQQGFIEHAVEVQIPVVREFLENRHEFLNQLALLRTDSSAFDSDRVHYLSLRMGRLEMEAAVIEAEAYRKIRASMNDDQVAALMKMRGEYVIDEAQVAAMDMEQRGATLAILCSGCHGAPGQHRVGLPAPSLDGFWDRKIASGPNFEYSAALTTMRRGGNETWTPELLDQFLANPKKFAPGTKMEFQGLLKEEDREALIEHLKSTR
jgi:cytochrome c2